MSVCLSIQVFQKHSIFLVLADFISRFLAGFILTYLHLMFKVTLSKPKQIFLSNSEKNLFTFV